jgi:Domain of unknown function (DUF4352)
MTGPESPAGDAARPDPPPTAWSREAQVEPPDAFGGSPPGTPPPFVPSGAPPLPPPPRGHRTLWIVLAACVAAVVVIGGITVGVIAATHALSHSDRPTTAAVGQPGRDGSLQFTAEQVTCGVDQVGPPDDFVTPTGQFCVVELKIRNVGTGPAIFTDAIQEAYAPNGNRFSTDSEAILYANPDPTIFLTDINPGIALTADIVYDIPVGERIARLKLHSTPDTRGVLINVH